MDKIQFSVIIESEVDKVWHTMLEDEGYRKWTGEFQEGSYYEGNWDEGCEMRFFAPGTNGKLQGMFSIVHENKKYKFISLIHRGLIVDGINDSTSDEYKKWSKSYENYTFNNIEDKTELIIDLNIPDEYTKMMEEMWPTALRTLKSLCEI